MRSDELEPAEIIAILAKNRKRLAVDPHSRSFRERLQTEHECSVERLADNESARAKLEAAVDALVFELYEVSSHQQLVADPL